MKYAGRAPSSTKIAAVQKGLQEAGNDAVVLTQPDSICWLFNIRGHDVAHNPVALCFRHCAGEEERRSFSSTRRSSRARRKLHLDGHVKIFEPRRSQEEARRAA